jgi:hypothetical protein
VLLFAIVLFLCRLVCQAEYHLDGLHASHDILDTSGTHTNSHFCTSMA